MPKKPNRVNTACERTVTSKQTTDKEDIQIYNYIYIFKIDLLQRLTNAFTTLLVL